MEPLTIVVSRACPLALENIDTDQLLPARFLARAREDGFADCLLRDLRFDENDTPIADFPLNSDAASGAQILVARRNFGAGSSREAAVYALADAGFRCIIAPSFGDIFMMNAINNGVLPAVVTEADAERVLLHLERAPDTVLTVDLTTCHVRFDHTSITFKVDRSHQQRLLHGWDELDLTRRHRAAIDAFRAEDEARREWVYLKERRRGGSEGGR